MNTSSENLLLDNIVQFIRLDCHKLKSKKLAIFGAGKFSKKIVPFFEKIKINFSDIIILDDNAEKNENIAGIPIAHPSTVSKHEYDAVFLSTDSMETLFKARIKEIFEPSIKIYTVSEIKKELNKTPDSPQKPKTEKTVWQFAYELWSSGKQCSDFKDSILLATILKSSAHYNERNFENGFVESLIFEKEPGSVLDIGSSSLAIPTSLNKKGFKITCIDPCVEDKIENGMQIIKGDIRSTKWEDNTFDYITCISTIEHIGVSGRYGIRESEPDGDKKAMDEMFRILKPGGFLYVTIPFGSVEILPINKVYTDERILSMSNGMKVVNSKFYKPDGLGGAIPCSKEEASENDWRRDGYYALGCYEFQK